jgi:hypothetical protein
LRPQAVGRESSQADAFFHAQSCGLVFNRRS